MSTTPDVPDTYARTGFDDLLGLRLGHRVMCRDARRLADLTAAWAAGTTTMTAARGRALVSWTDRLATEIHQHHTAEDDILWPVLVRRAGAAVDLTALSDDHAALDPVLTELRGATRDAVAGRGEPAVASAAHRALAEQLVEHIDEEERDLFPVIYAHVPLAEWKAVEKGVRERGGDMFFVLPRLASVCTDEEFARLRAEAGPVLMVLLWFARRRLHRDAQLLFGTDA